MNYQRKDNTQKNSFRLSDEARAEIDNEYSDVSQEYLDRLGYNRSGDEEFEDSDEEYDNSDEEFEDSGEEYDSDEEFDDSDEEYDDSDEECGDSDEENDDSEEEEAPRKPKKHWLLKISFKLFKLSLVVIMIDIIALFYSGQLWFNQPKKRDYPIRGPVITEAQGTVDWKNFAKQNLQMCYIRATKGTTYVDKCFKGNRSGSSKTSLPTGMLHIFDPMASGSKQAEHFIEVCGSMDGRLRPAVDCDMGLLNKVLSPGQEKLSSELRAFVDRIKEEYGCTPVLKCGSRFYEKVAGSEDFDDCPIWFVSEFSKPDKEVRWDLWGYSSRVKFDYYEKKSFLEMVLLDGDEERLDEMYI